MEEQSILQSPMPSKPKQGTVGQKKARAKPKALPRKLMAFDIDLLSMIQRGENTVDHLLLLTGVDPLQFFERVEFLCSKKLACRDASNPQVLLLGLKGYDELAKVKLAAQKRALRSEQKRSLSATPAAEPRKAPDESNAVEAEASKAKVPFAVKPASAEIAVLASPVHDQQPQSSVKADSNKDIDLFDLLQRGSPKNGSSKVSYRAPLASRQLSQKPLPFEQQVKELGGKEAVREMIEQATQAGACELCRSPFKLSVRAQENNPKYGYCFCGASYHRDCYESLAHSDEAACVRCGKKLRIQMDRSSEAAFKAIKRLFD